MVSLNLPAAVAITGVGAFTAAGEGARNLWAAVVEGKSHAQWREPAQEAGPRAPVCAAPEVDLDPTRFLRLRRMDRSVQMACSAALEAWNDAGLDGIPTSAGRTAIFVGTSRGPLGTVLDSQAAFASGARVWPSVAPNSSFGSLSGALAVAFGAQGPCLTISSTCASSAAAIALGAQQILCGAAERALVGGAEAPLHDVIIAQMNSARVLASDACPQSACRPFDSARTGTVLGEGAAFLVLESLEAARKRGARVWGQLAGWGLGSEGGERTGISDDAECLHAVMRDALAMAGLSFAELDYINAHGTGTVLNDKTEAQAIAQFGPASARPLTSSTKAVMGHCMGAAGAIEAVISLFALQEQLLPPTANCFAQASDCPIGLVLGAARSSRVAAVLSNSAGFWGNNASLLFTQPRDE